MKKYAFLVAMTLLVTPGLALSQTNTGTHTTNGGNSAQFQARKTKILQNISQRLTELQQRKSCVQAATNSQALSACRPQQKG